MTLRWLRLVVVPTTGPRSAAVAAAQWMGSAPWPPACEVRRMCWEEGGAEESESEEGAEGEEGAGAEEACAGAKDLAATSAGICLSLQRIQCSDECRA